MRYNIDADGYVSAFGLFDNYEYEYTDEPFTSDDFQWWRKVEGGWVRLTEDEFKQKYGAI